MSESKPGKIRGLTVVGIKIQGHTGGQIWVQKWRAL